MFKAGDKVRCIDNDQREELLTLGKEYIINDYYNTLGNNNVELKGLTGYGFFVDRFELAEEKPKEQKTLLEIIKDGFTNKVYIDEKGNTVYVASNNQLIFHYAKAIKDDYEITMHTLDLNLKYKLERKEYGFPTAFIAYEQGKEIQSLATSQRYNKKYDDTEKLMIAYKEIVGKWYINC